MSVCLKFFEQQSKLGCRKNRSRFNSQLESVADWKLQTCLNNNIHMPDRNSNQVDRLLGSKRSNGGRISSWTHGIIFLCNIRLCCISQDLPTTFVLLCIFETGPEKQKGNFCFNLVFSGAVAMVIRAILNVICIMYLIILFY